MEPLSDEIRKAIDESTEAVIDTVVSDAIPEFLDHRDPPIAQIDFDDRAIAHATHAAVAALGPTLRGAAFSQLAATQTHLLRVSRPGDGAAISLPRLESLSTGASSRLQSLRYFPMADAASEQLGAVEISIDTTAAAEEANDQAKKDAAAEGIKGKICGDLREWFEKKLDELKKAVAEDGLKATLKKWLDKVKELAAAGIAALVAIGMTQWAAYLLLGLVVALIAAALYYLVKYGLPKYCA